MAITKNLRFVRGVGVVFTAYDLGRAGVASFKSGSLQPVAAESVCQLGGWGVAGSTISSPGPGPWWGSRRAPSRS
jgi:hypothetical protein